MSDTMEDGKLVKRLEVQQRGEPKSGTGFMFEWAGGLLVHMCGYLNKIFGDNSCAFDYELSGDTMNDLKHLSLTFEPGKATPGTARCLCSGVDRWSRVIEPEYSFCSFFFSHCRFRCRMKRTIVMCTLLIQNWVEDGYVAPVHLLVFTVKFSRLSPSLSSRRRSPARDRQHRNITTRQVDRHFFSDHASTTSKILIHPSGH